MSNLDALGKMQQEIGEAIDRSGIKGGLLKAALRGVMAKFWPSLPGYSTLEHVKVEEVQKATVGVGVALTFREHGAYKVVMLKAGDNYPAAQQEEKYMIPGGFLNLTQTPGSSLVAPLERAEDARAGAARETEEELRLPDGSPVLRVDPKRLKPMDVKTLMMPGGPGIAIGMMLELNPQEVAAVKAHVKALETDPAYAQAALAHTVNPQSGKAEVAGVSMVPLRELAKGKTPLLHEDQQSLFEALADHFNIGPSRAI